MRVCYSEQDGGLIELRDVPNLAIIPYGLMLTGRAGPAEMFLLEYLGYHVLQNEQGRKIKHVVRIRH